MAFTGNQIADVFRLHLLEGVHDFRPGQHQFRLALYGPGATLTAATVAYTPDHEIPDSPAYTAGGLLVSPAAPLLVDRVGAVTFEPAVFSGGPIAARGALLYNATPAHSYTNPAIAVLDFGAVRTSVDGTFTVAFPLPTAEAALLRVAP
jgi:hypothetical protein